MGKDVPAMGLLVSFWNRGKERDIIKAGLGKQLMVLCPWRSACLSGDRSYSTIEAYT